MDILKVHESSPDTPLGSISRDLNLSKAWIFHHLEKLGLTKFDIVYILGSWYGSLGLFLLDSHIKFDQAINIDIDPEKSETVAHVMKRMKLNDRIHTLTQDCNTTRYQGETPLIINTSTNDIRGRDWFNNIKSGTVVVLQGKNNQEFSNGEDTLDRFNRAYPLDQTLFVGYLTLDDVHGEPYQRYMKIGYK